MVATAVADSIEQPGELADRVMVPNVRYRRDIGSTLVEGDFAFVEALGLFDPIG
jgi:hypothetical protein